MKIEVNLKEQNLSYRVCRLKGSAKLLTVKVKVPRKNLPLGPIQTKCEQAHVARIWVCPGLNHSQSLTDSIFESLYAKELIIPVWKDNPFKSDVIFKGVI